MGHLTLLGAGKPPAGPLLLLDSISNVTAAWSFRKLRTAYAGNCCRIRRSSDNAEADFGFVANVVDTAGIATHIGGGSGFIVTWYDQSASGFDVTQATAGNQPQFIASAINSLPSGRYPATANADGLRRASVNITTLLSASGESTIFLAQKQTGTQAQNTTLSFIVAAVNHLNIHATYDNVIYFDVGSSGANGRVSVAQPSGWDDAPHITELYKQANDNQAIVVDGAAIANATKTDDPSGTGTLCIGDYNGASIAFKGDISEIIICSSENSTQRNTVRKDGVGTGAAQGMGPYYGVTVA